MPVQKRLAQVGFAKQTAKDSPVATAAYQIGVMSGAVVNAEVDEEDLPVTWSSRLLEGHDRKTVMPGAEYEFVVLPKSIGVLLHAVTGAVLTTGASAPFSHEFTPAADLPYLTLFARQGGEYFEVDNAKVNELELSWEQTGALRGKVSLYGTTLSFLASAYTADADERPSGGLLKGSGGTFTIDAAAATISKGSVKISNNVEAVYGSDSVEPADVFPALHTLDLSLTVIPEDLTLFRQVITGTGAGTTAQAVSEYGAAVAQFVLDANTDLNIDVANMRFATEFPEAEGEGGPVEIELEGSVAAPAAGDAYTITLRNDVTAY